MNNISECTGIQSRHECLICARTWCANRSLFNRMHNTQMAMHVFVRSCIEFAHVRFSLSRSIEIFFVLVDIVQNYINVRIQVEIAAAMQPCALHALSLSLSLLICLRSRAPAMYMQAHKRILMHPHSCTLVHWIICAMRVYEWGERTFCNLSAYVHTVRIHVQLSVALLSYVQLVVVVIIIAAAAAAPPSLPPMSLLLSWSWLCLLSAVFFSFCVYQSIYFASHSNDKLEILKLN